uniref:Si:ch211-168d1.3 n=1 Tax=Scophthalmus maximus TaxID=52904 RepID=A0A8D3C4V1_SCOMX
MQEVGGTQRGPPRAFSVLDRLLLTHPVWLQLSLNRDSALYILLREPVGVRRPIGPSNSCQTLLCLFPVKPAFALESSALSFPDLCRLVAFYCISRDVLPFPLELPEAIAKATSHRQLEAISHMGQDFWSPPSSSDVQNGPVDPSAPTSGGRAARTAVAQDRCSLLALGRRGKICFINPLFLQLEVSKVSREGFSALSPPPPPPPPPLWPRIQLPLGWAPSRRRPRWSIPTGPRGCTRPASGIEVAVLALERRPAPSLAELDSSSSFSSMDEDSDSDSGPEGAGQAQALACPRPPLVRSRGRGGLHRISEAFVCFFAPDKRLTRLVEELSRDRRSVFGGMVQDFLLAQRGTLKSLLLQGLRLFLSQAKCCLLDSGELEPPIETLVPENEKDLALERAMFSCVLRPLRSHLEKALVALHDRDGSSQRLARNLLRLRGDAAMERLGVRTGVPDGRGVERAKQKLALMQRTHSPVDKVLLLLQVCKCVHKEVSWDDFLPSLSYVLVECNRPHTLIEVEYMMELLEPSWLGGEGGYYLTSAYASLCLIQSLDQERPLSGCLTPEAQEALKEWSCRRSREAQRQKESQQNQVGTSDRQHRHAVVCSSGGEGKTELKRLNIFFINVMKMCVEPRNCFFRTLRMAGKNCLCEPHKTCPSNAHLWPQ